MPTAADAAPIGLGEVHHRGYLVDDLVASVERLHRQFGAGPFFVMDPARLRGVSSRGAPAEYLHGSAFGICNGAPIELIRADRLAPARVGERFVGLTPRLHHLAFAVSRSEVEAARAGLERLGSPEYLHAHFADDVDYTYHDGSASFGHDIEVHADGEDLRGFFGLVADAAKNWDGTDPIRMED